MFRAFIGVNEAFTGLVTELDGAGYPHVIRESSRYGNVMRFTDPVLITYRKPWQRVLFNKGRDANPFFHLFESLWMLAGKDTVEPLAYFNSRMQEFSDDGTTFNAPYGFRWRNHFGRDQLSWVVNRLRGNANDRRVVLQIYDCRKDQPAADMGSKDIPCNTQAYFSISNCKLDMTVCNRSNDLVWGMLGANMVHFSFLQEFIASQLDIRVGRYHQFTNNLHAYLSRWEPGKWLSIDHHELSYPTAASIYDRHFRQVGMLLTPNDAPLFLSECAILVDNYGKPASTKLKSPFLKEVAVPALSAFYYHKQRQYDEAEHRAANIRQLDWKVACLNWIQRRRKNWEAKNDQAGTD